MAREFLAQALSTNGVAVGGLASMAFNASFQDVVVSEADGAVGAEDVDRAGMSIGVTCECTDVKKSNAILDAAVATTTFYGRESHATTYKLITVEDIVWMAMNLTLSKNADGRLSLNGLVRPPDGSTGLDDIIVPTGAQSAPSLTYPARLFRPHNGSFDPGSPITITHLESIGLSLTAEQFQDYADDDIGMTSVDRGGFGALQVTATFKDRSQAEALLDAARGVLTLDLVGRAGGDEQTLTVNNLLWTGISENKGKDYWSYTLTGSAGWRKHDPVTPINYTLNSTNKLFEIADKA
jgi:hypothetical protein